MYVAVMFPYPSNSSLHLGHYYNYAVMDSYCRWKRFKGETVFQPFGFDAFGLPAENYAKQIGGDPREITYKNIDNFRQQMSRMNTQYEEKLVTCDPSYVKWTQWLFLKLLEHNKAYKSWGEVNWCTGCNTVLANEQVTNDKCERCSSKIEIRNMNQWYFRISDYKDRLIKNLDTVDYPEGTKKQQRLWLENLKDWCVSRQRKWGCPIPVEGEEDTLDTFVDSSFYFLRYLTNNEQEFLPSEDYRQVDLYVGGREHACMHLIYARFIHMFLYDLGIVPVEEPFKKVIHQGVITKDGSKMGKSKGNAVSPDNFDPDELRMYLMFLGHYFDAGAFDEAKIIGITRFLNKIRTWAEAGPLSSHGQFLNVHYADTTTLEQNIDNYVNDFKFNKVISELMSFYNTHKKDYPNERFLQILKCFAPGFTNVCD